MTPPHSPEFPSARAAGQPLRFVALILLLWTGGRLWAWLVPGAPAPLPPGAPARHTRPASTASASPRPSRQLPASFPADPASPARRDRAHRPTDFATITAARHTPPPPLRPFRLAPSGRPTPAADGAAAPGLEGAPTPLRASPGARIAAAPAPASAPLPHRRWNTSFWLLARDGSRGEPLGPGGQLGGSQAGARLDYRLAGTPAASATSAYLRLSRALQAPAAPEAAVGLAFHAAPIRVLPLSLGVERRIALAAPARTAFALVATAGLSPLAVGAGLTAEGYAQAGAVGLTRRDPFVDGRLALTRPLDRPERLAVGLAVSGGAQPHARRLDIGPAAHIRLPLGPGNDGASGGLRLTVEWRQRIAGEASPGSGPALTLGGYF